MIHSKYLVFLAMVASSKNLIDILLASILNIIVVLINLFSSNLFKLPIYKK